MRIFKIISCLALATLFSYCSSSERMVNETVPNAYSDATTDFEVDYTLFQFKPDSSRLYVRINTKNLLYARRGNTTSAAAVILKIQPVNADFPSKTIRILDTDKDKKAKMLIAHADIALPDNVRSDLILTFTDENRSRTIEKTLTANKTDRSHRQNYLVLDPEKKVPIFSDRVKPQTIYQILVNSDILDEINLRFYNRDFQLPPPPFFLYEPKPFDYDADSVTTLPLNGKSELTIKTGSSGFYHFNADTENKKGLTLFVSDADFPKLTSVDDLVGSMRYLMGGKEYEDILNAPDPKIELERKWVSWAGSQERARKSIEAYFKRVEKANFLFSSYVEGWRTDRGLIYIVYGKPNKVYQTDKVETWIYGEENNPLSITMHFIKVINPFTENDYRLDRQELYKPSWYRAVNAWRDGRLY